LPAKFHIKRAGGVEAFPMDHESAAFQQCAMFNLILQPRLTLQYLVIEANLHFFWNWTDFHPSCFGN